MRRRALLSGLLVAALVLSGAVTVGPMLDVPLEPDGGEGQEESPSPEPEPEPEPGPPPAEPPTLEPEEEEEEAPPTEPA